MLNTPEGTDWSPCSPGGMYASKCLCTAANCPQLPQHAPSLPPRSPHSPPPPQSPRSPPCGPSPPPQSPRWDHCISRTAFDIDVLKSVAIHPKHMDALAFVDLLHTASLDDPIAKLNDTALYRLWHPPHTQLTIDDEAVRFGIKTYFSLEHSANSSYESIRQLAGRCFKGSALDVPSHYSIEKMISEYMGVESIEHNMCPNTCMAFTGVLYVRRNAMIVSDWEPAAGVLMLLARSSSPSPWAHNFKLFGVIHNMLRTLAIYQRRPGGSMNRCTLMGDWLMYMMTFARELTISRPSNKATSNQTTLCS